MRKKANAFVKHQAKENIFDVSFFLVLGVERRNLYTCPKSVKETAYKTLFRPTLEYGSAAWDPYYEKDIHKLQRVQRKAARFFACNYNPYDRYVAGT